LTEGAAKHGPYDPIFLQGAVENAARSIADQIKEGGRIAVLFKRVAHWAVVRIGLKAGGLISWRFRLLMQALQFVPGFAKTAAFRFRAYSLPKKPTNDRWSSLWNLSRVLLSNETTSNGAVAWLGIR